MSFASKTSRDILRFGMVAATAFSFVGQAGAIDRKPFAGGFVSDARPGYGTQSSGYGAERQYYGAESRVLRQERSGWWSGPDARYGGSIVRFGDRSIPGDDGFVSPFDVEDARSGVYPGFDTGSAGGIVYLDDQAQDATSDDRPRPNLRRVDEERLDRQPVDPSGITVFHAGTAKIIRIASSAGGTGAARPSEKKSTIPGGLAPWSESWERYCSRAHPSFDANLGTFTDAQGGSRFCTGD